MAGRGRGRGSGLSLTIDQLQALGIARGEAPASKLEPPPLFPKLQTKPLPLVSDAATDYMLIVKEQFISYLHDSPAYVRLKVHSDGVERYSDKYKLLAQDAKQGKVLNYVCANFPAELRPQVNRVRATRKRKLDDPNEIVKRLQSLEKKESQEGTEETQVNDGNSAKPKTENNDDEEIEDEEEQDEEIDDGTDYANNYFDNGEDYDEEDDNLDDGPVY